MKALIVTLLIVVIFGAAGYFAYDLFVKPKQQARKPDVAEATPTPPPDPSLAEFQKAILVKKEGDLEEARGALQQFIEAYPESSKAGEAKKALGEVNTDIFFSSYPSPDKTEYIVQRGDALVKIARKTNATAELIMKANNMESTMLQVGARLLIPEADFSIKVDPESQTVTLFNKGEFFKEYKAREWSMPKPRGASEGKVTETIAWKEGDRVAFGTKEYAGSARWILTTVSGCTLYTAPTDEEEVEAEKPGTGIGLSPADMEEISALVRRNVPVTVG